MVHLRLVAHPALAAQMLRGMLMASSGVRQQRAAPLARKVAIHHRAESARELALQAWVARQPLVERLREARTTREAIRLQEARSQRAASQPQGE